MTIDWMGWLSFLPIAAWFAMLLVVGAGAAIRRKVMAKRGQETKYWSPDAEYADETLRIRDARIHLVEALEDRHAKMLRAQQYRNVAEHLEWEIAAGGQPLRTWLLQPRKYGTPWDPERDWEPMDPDHHHYRGGPGAKRTMADEFDRQAMEVVPQIENCAATVRSLTSARDRIYNPQPTGWEAFIETFLWPYLIWSAIRIVRKQRASQPR